MPIIQHGYGTLPAVSGSTARMRTVGRTTFRRLPAGSTHDSIGLAGRTDPSGGFRSNPLVEDSCRTTPRPTCRTV